jgi:hypothetical protein
MFTKHIRDESVRKALSDTHHKIMALFSPSGGQSQSGGIKTLKEQIEHIFKQQIHDDDDGSERSFDPEHETYHQ